MLRSKFRRPWQPRVSDGELFNPFAHSSESRSDLAQEIEEREEPAHGEAQAHPAVAPDAAPAAPGERRTH